LFAFAAVVWFLLEPLTRRSFLGRACRKLARENAADVAGGPTTLELGDEGILSSSPSGNAMYRYAAIDRIDQTPRYTYVFVGKSSAHVLPHDRLASDDLDEFLLELQRRREAASQTE
jgi:hypothetical protein